MTAIVKHQAKFSLMPRLLVLMCLAVSFITLADEESQSVGKLISKKKSVVIARDNTAITAKRGTSIVELDTVKTVQDGRAILRFDDGTMTTLGENSEFTVDKYVWRKGKTGSEAEFTLIKGVFRTITGAMTKAAHNKDEPPKFKVQTPLGSIGIRGTDFWGGYLNPNEIDVLFIDGEHPIEISNEFGVVVLTKPGEGTTIKPGQAPSKAKVWPLSKVQRAVATIEVNE